ncbi:MAG: hypothetical protein ACXVBB_23480, partial [Isosphaeraceae bacterium]
VMKAEQGGVREVRYRSNFSEPRGTSMTLLVAAACELNRERRDSSRLIFLSARVVPGQVQKGSQVNIEDDFSRRL